MKDQLLREKQHTEMLWPTVRIAAEKAWGSGTVIYSGITKSGEYKTYVITCHHVIAGNIQITKRFDHRVGFDIKQETRVPAEVQFFYYEKLSKCSGMSGSVKADIVAYDEDVDVALLELKRGTKVEPTATLYPIDEVEDVHIFDEVWACGAAMAHEPIATFGIINYMNEVMEKGIEYWMSNAQIIFGNSGGAIFRYSKDRDCFEFLGIPARIVVNMAGFSQDAITHMGFFVPITRIYKFLEDNFYDFICNTKKTFEECEKQRDKYKAAQEKLLIAKFGGSPDMEKKEE